MSARCSGYQHLILRVHGITFVLEFHGSQWSRRSEVPVLVDTKMGRVSSISDHVLGKV